MRSIRTTTLGPLGRAACTTILLAALAPAPTARAQWAVAEVGPSAVQHLLNQINTLTQQIQDYAAYGEQAMRWKATWDHYYQQVARFMSVVRNPTLSNKLSFNEVPLDYGVAEKCGAGAALDVTSIASGFIPDFGGDVIKNQQRLCGHIQMLENQKYNATVRYMKDVAPVLQQDLAKIQSQRAANNEQGTLQAINEASARLAAKQNESWQELRAQVESCDQLIAGLSSMQKSLARQALKGKSEPIIGTLVKTATLEAALKAK